MSHDAKESSPMVERPSLFPETRHGRDARSASGSALPVYEMNPMTRQLLEENEDMLYRISGLTRDVASAQSEIQKLNDVIKEKDKELEAMREKLGNANISVCDASGKVINYKTECERLTEENKRLVKEYESVAMELEQQTENIRQNTDRMRSDTARGSAAALEEQFYREMLSLFPAVDRVVNSLRRCVVVDVTNRERVLDSAQKELRSMQRLGDSVRRMSIGEEGHVNDIVASLRRGEEISSPGDLAIIIRWMVVQAFQSGMTATEGNLKAMEMLLATERNDSSSNNNNNNNNNNNSNNNNKSNGAAEAGKKSAFSAPAHAVRRMLRTSNK